MTDPAIRQATSDDAESLASVYRSAYEENSELGFPTKAVSATGETVTEWVRDYQLYVAELDDDIVGGVRLEETDPDRMKLGRLGVHEAYKGRGIGSSLLAYAEKSARKQGFGEMWLTTPDEHPHLPDFYRRHGYEKTGEYPLEYRDYDEIVMEKRLR
jgi:ribosomal protein S18 acetylase RimI-like enzyme